MKFDFTKYFLRTADFETSTEAWGVDSAVVWLWDICDCNLSHRSGNSLDSFMEYVLTTKPMNTLYCFHNLAYDGVYIISWLLNNGYKCVDKNDKDLRGKTFTCLITQQGLHYAYAVRGKYCTIFFMDSYKYIHTSVEDMAKLYDLPILKGKIDYDTVREEGHIPTEEELSYIHNDTEIVMRAILKKLEGGEVKFTQSGNAREFFKDTFDKKTYDSYFPQLELSEDAYIRRAYSGGYTYLNPVFASKDLGDMVSLDCNSMYPAQMLHELMPYGRPVWFNGEYEQDDEYPLYVQTLSCSFTLKKGKTPTIPKKKVFNKITPEYMTDSNFSIVTLTLSNVDLELMKDNYALSNVRYIDGYKFKARKGYEVSAEEASTMTVDEIIEKDGVGSFFYEYFKKWRYIKEHSDGVVRVNAKLMQNGLYGVFATNPLKSKVFPYLDGDLVRYKVMPKKETKAMYLPIAIFVTAYSRKLLINLINRYKDRFVYCDTDSMYLVGSDVPSDMKIHPSLYGFFKVEHVIKKARFLGDKRYIYYAHTPKDEEDKWTVVCCGANKEVKEQMNWDNFKSGNKFNGKITMKTVKGGKHLVETTYELKSL